MPTRACASAVACVRSAPAKTMRPSLGLISPAIQLKKVDLPAPLGPIRPTISPSATERLTPDTARKLPKTFAIPCALSSIFSPQQLRTDAVVKFVQTARLEPRKQNDNASIENVGEPRPTSAKPCIARRLQWHEDECADERTKKRAGSSEGGHDQQLHRHKNAETAIRI